ncbi:thioester reductase domain-containing protein [Streptomyces roseirectus]|uniref:Carboxylic acid reductase n=1 Tax=Streptomyces roseirectus TaxID=2768066 RepID=A0A7H0I6F1_9ACTN|nr:carboxylic acid reductase [Streptomyces roseirectus]QNP68367.1 thioester reductase domain-containing protein [Streptomyces roseirectus]
MPAKPSTDVSPGDRAARLVAHLSAHDPQYRAAMPLPSVREAVRLAAREQVLSRTVATVMEGYADRPALARRATEPVTDPATGRTSLRPLPAFTTVSYGELWERAGAVTAEWAADVRAGDFVALYGFTSGDHVTLDLACLRHGVVTVPLQTGAPVATLTPILAETAPKVLASSLELLDRAVELALSAEPAPRLVVFDFHPADDAHREAFDAASARLTAAGHAAPLSLEAVIERGRALPPAPLFVPGPDEDPVRLLIYTSGSTGTPKGAIQTERMLHRAWAGAVPIPDGVASIVVNYLPLSHVAGRSSLVETLRRGGISYFTARSDLSALFEDIALARPTALLFVPRVCDTLFQEYQSERARRAGEFTDPQALDAAVKADLRERLIGGRLIQALYGSAPLSAELREFMRTCLDLPVLDGYGSTETGSVLLNTRVQRPPVLDVKLVDVPELGYFRTDLPHPRGELVLKSATLTPGYYKRPEETAAAFDVDGFYRTGDIMAEVGPDQYVYVDRRNNVVKLAQGEFVALSRLEGVYVTHPLIRQIYVYGNSERAHLLAVIVPTEEALTRPDVHGALTEALREAARDAELNAYEIPRAFLIETEPFSLANGLLSDTRKNLPPRLRARYGERLEELYGQLARAREEAVRAVREESAGRPVLETVGRAVQALLGSAAQPGARFTELGGDSLSALSFSTLLTEVFGVEVPVGTVLSPAHDLRGLAGHIEARLASGAGRPSFASVHGAGATVVRAADLTLDRFLDAGTLAAAAELPAPDGALPRHVLLTGANGYLGRFMCLDWLERLAGGGGRLVCVVRGTDDADARARLDAAFDTGDADLLHRYRELADGRLDVLAGDIGAERLGLAEETWLHLAAETDLVAHPAALVNHVLPYEQLFGPNVAGTAELIRLAVTTRIKRFVHVSTTAISPALDETTDLAELIPERALSDAYASGYATSKWASEILLREAHARFGVPVTVFRSDLILAHPHHTGQLNPADVLTRLLFSVLRTGLAPESFYAGPGRAHFDGLPVDFTAEAVNALGSQASSGGAQASSDHRTYNAVNPHDDGISLDTFITWLEEAGHRFQRLPHADWSPRLATALRALPEHHRTHSLLPLLHAFTTPQPPTPTSPVTADRFRAAVREAGLGPDKDIPHLSRDLIVKYANDLRARGLL